MTNLIMRTLAYVVFLVCVSLLVVELSLRVFAPMKVSAGSLMWYEYDDELGVKLKENLAEVSIIGDYQAEINTNHVGTVNYHDKFDKFDKIVFSIGDSFTQGTGLYSDAVYPFQLDLLLNLENNEYVENFGVVNLGLAAYGLEQSLISLRRFSRLIRKPDYILFLGYSNDYSDDEVFIQGYRHRHLVDGNPNYSSVLLPLMQWASSSVEIIKRVKLFYSLLKRSDIVGDEQGVTEADYIIAAKQEARLDRLLNTSNEMGARLIVSWATNETDDDGSYVWLKQWAKDNEVGFADWWPVEMSVKQAIPLLPRGNQHVGGHYKTWVNTIIARSFAEQF